MSTNPADADLRPLADPPSAAAAATTGPVPANPGSASAGGERDVDPPGRLAYPSLARWVGDYLAPTLRRERRQDQAWCPQWWRHAEAISRLEALWRAWESLRQDGTVGMSVWWRDHADYHLRLLLDGREGPFTRCRGEHGGENPPLAVEEPPEEWFGAARG